MNYMERSCFQVGGNSKCDNPKGGHAFREYLRKSKKIKVAGRHKAFRFYSKWIGKPWGGGGVVLSRKKNNMIWSLWKRTNFPDVLTCGLTMCLKIDFSSMC